MEKLHPSSGIEFEGTPIHDKAVVEILCSQLYICWSSYLESQNPRILVGLQFRYGGGYAMHIVFLRWDGIYLRPKVITAVH
jgi:hypothetical protein